MWVLLLIRNLLIIPFIFLASVLLSIFNLGFGLALWTLILFPVVGIIGCSIAMASDFQRKNHTIGTVGGVLALVGSSFPGPFFGIGIVGLILGVIGLALHLGAHKDFT
jgi:hypothetical protein